MYPKLLYLLPEISKMLVQLSIILVKILYNPVYILNILTNISNTLIDIPCYLLLNHENYDGTLNFFVEISNISDEISNILGNFPGQIYKRTQNYIKISKKCVNYQPNPEYHPKTRYFLYNISTNKFQILTNMFEISSEMFQISTKKLRFPS